MRLNLRTFLVMEISGGLIFTMRCSLNQVVAVDVFLTDMGNFLEFNGIYEAFFGGHKPARAVIEVSGLPKGGCVEIKCIVNG